MRILRLIDKVFPPKIAFAHCDIPCGIYDPHEAQMAAHSVLRMTNLINDLKASSNDPEFDERKKIISQISRLTKIKEEHAELVKQQVRIIWGDYFKEEHFEKYRDLNDLVFKIMKQASIVRQNVDEKACRELIEVVQKFAQIFWQTKDRKTVKAKSGYPTEGEVVLPQ